MCAALMDATRCFFLILSEVEGRLIELQFTQAGKHAGITSSTRLATA